MSETTQKHQYSPLDPLDKEIRLLTVQRRSQNVPLTDPVRCTLRRISLREVPCSRYETISYVWGAAENTASLFLNGREATVPASAEKALRCMRFHSGA